MFLTPCWPISAKPIGNFSPTCSRTEALTQISPGSASVWRRAATLTPSPKMSPSSWMTSPRLMPIRKRIRSGSGRLTLRSAIPCWTTTAQRTASTTEANSIRMPSPVVLKMRPPCWAISGSISSRRSLFRTARVPSSSALISREYSTTSAQRIAASRRSTRSSTNVLLPYPALFRQPQPAQRVADRFPDLGAAGMSPHKAGDRKPGLQLEPPLSRDLGLLDATQLRQRGGAQKVGQAEPWIGLFTLAAGRDRRLPVAGRTMGDAEPDVGYVDCSVERAPAQRAFGIIDRLRRPSGMAEDYRSQAQRQRRGRGQCQAAVDRVHRRVVIVVDQTDDEPGGRQGPSVVRTGLERGAGMG